MQTTIAEADIQRGSVNTVNVGSIGIGPVTIGQLVLTDFELNTAADGAFLRNFVVTVTYTMKLDWLLHIDLPGLPGNAIDQSGTEDLDSPTFIFGLGDIRVYSSDRFRLVRYFGLKFLGKSSGDLRNSNGVGKPIVKDMPFVSRHDLSYATKPSECRRVQDSVVIALRRFSVIRRFTFDCTPVPASS